MRLQVPKEVVAFTASRKSTPVHMLLVYHSHDIGMCHSRDNTQEQKKHIMVTKPILSYSAAPSSDARSCRLPLLPAPPCVVASFAACLPCIVGHHSPVQQHCRRYSHSILLLPPPSCVARHAVHRPLLLPPTTVVDRPLWSSRIFIQRLLSFLSSPVPCLL
jgi:hypothetical protein